jgi:hypothetical protein
MFENRLLRRIFGPKRDEATGGYREDCIMRNFIRCTLLLLLLFSLALQPSLGHGLLHKIRLNFVEAFQQFSLLQGRIVSPTPNPHPGGPDLCIYIPQRQGGHPF